MRKAVGEKARNNGRKGEAGRSAANAKSDGEILADEVSGGAEEIKGQINSWIFAVRGKKKCSLKSFFTIQRVWKAKSVKHG